jgi:hypothetical protein
MGEMSMARAKNQTNGRLEEAIAILLQNQAAFLARASEIDRQRSELQQRVFEMDRLNSERFARIEAILIEHTRILRALPEAIREKIGFKVPEQS